MLVNKKRTKFFGCSLSGGSSTIDEEVEKAEHSNRQIPVAGHLLVQFVGSPATYFHNIMCLPNFLLANKP